MKGHLNIYALITTLIIIVGCSTRKDAFLNRSFHSVTAKYNILYNGNLAYENGLQELHDNYSEDYRNRLPIERLQISELAIPGVGASSDNSNASFEKAEEKAVKAVQKHSMNISGKERNQQIDDAFLLLGKSRYYSQRFVPSLEAFNYIVLNYPKADLIQEAKIWQAKAQLRLQNEELALRILKQLLKTKELLDKETVESTYTAIAMVYEVMDSTSQVIHHLKQSLNTSYNKEQLARNGYILGQIYRERNQIDSSNIAFERVIDMKKIPYRYQIHAEIEIAKNLSGGENSDELIETLEKLIKDRQNRPYLDELHYYSGLIHKNSGRVDLAEEHFIASAHARDAQQFQIGLSYEELGDLQFDKANYVASGAYYDSVLQLPQDRNSKRIRKLERKSENLKEVIYYEGVTVETDSILNVVAMSKDDQVLYFQEYIDGLIALENETQEQLVNTGTGSFEIGNNNQFSTGSSKWYFYNTQVVGFGSQEFFKIWGNRPFEDNWRLSDKSVLKLGEAEPLQAGLPLIEEDKKYDVNAYLETIPTDQNVIDSITSVGNEAYYQLGLIYKEQFKQYQMASYKFEDLLSFQPEEKYVLPSKYHLYKIYLELNDIRSDKYKEEIVKDYPESKYAQLLLNPEQALAAESDENSPENIYKKIYYSYQEENYQEVIKSSEEAIRNYSDSEVLPKFELLRAYAIGKKEGVVAFRKALEFVAITYSNSEEGKKALEVIETINKL